MPGYRLTKDIATLWFQAPFVMAVRLQQLSVAAMTGETRNGAEFNRMITEKMAAAAESAVATHLAIAQQSLSVMTAMTFGQSRPAQRAAKAIAGAAVKPYSKRVRSNAQRLSRKKD